MSRIRTLWAKWRPKRNRIEFRRGKRYRTVFIPRPDDELLEDIESSFTEPRPKES